MLKKTLAMTSVILLGGCSVRPVAVTPENIRKTAENDKIVLSQGVGAIAGVISLEDAIARALLNNRQRKLQKLETALAHGQLKLAKYEMLPELTASAGYSKRNNYAASASVLFNDGTPGSLRNNPSYSVSQDKKRTTYDAAFTWNILDFGLSYVRARQNADMYLISQERERKVVHNITQDVRTAYWRGVSAERLLKNIGPLIKRTRAAIKDSQTVERQRLKAPLQALYYQRELLDILRSLQSLQQELTDAKTVLAELIGVKPGVSFQLKDVDEPSFHVPELSFDLATMEDTALNNRPELIESHYQKRISAAETRAAVLKMLPGINLTAGSYHDNNDYLLNQNWTSFGAQISWNLLHIFRINDEQFIAQTRGALAEQQRLATSMAVLTQVHLSKIRFEQTKKSFALSKRYLDVATRIHDQISNETRSESASELDLMRESLNVLLAELRRDVAYADLQNGFSRIFVTMGLDLTQGSHSGTDLPALSASIRAQLRQWQSGKLADSVQPQ